MRCDPVPPVPKSPRLPKWIVLLTTAIFLVGIPWGLYSAKGQRRWARMESTLKELRSEVDGRNLERPVLRGTKVSGDGWDEYRLGLEEIASVRSGFQLLSDYACHRPNIDLEKVEVLLTAYGYAVERLQRGVMRGYGRFPFRWEDDSDHQAKSKACGNLAILAICKARVLARSGALQESLELLLDTCQFARDLGSNSSTYTELHSMQSLGLAMHDLRELLLSGRLSRDQLLQMERELQVIDEAFPRNAQALLNDPIRKGFWRLEFDQREGGFSGLQRGYFAEKFEVTWELMSSCRDLDDLSWSEVQAKSIRIENRRTELNRGSGSYMDIEPPLWSERMVRERRAQLRLLRVAARYRATGELLDLDDPFGAKLLTRTSGNTLHVRSAGYSNQIEIALEVHR